MKVGTVAGLRRNERSLQLAYRCTHEGLGPPRTLITDYFTPLATLRKAAQWRTPAVRRDASGR